MAKIELDKYYTPNDVVDKCLDVVKEIMVADNVIPSQVIEPSAGSGAFSNKIKGCIAYDIDPNGKNIIKADFLKLDIPYKKDTLIIGNPPFGDRMSLAVKFFKKSIQIADYIGFILPISQLNNTMTLYEFDLVKSIDLGLREYSNVKLHCCFNVYRRPKYKLNSRPKSKLNSVKICRQDSKGYKDFDYDIRLCYWGDGTAGKILKDNENYSGEYKIKILNGFKDRVIDVLKNIDWRAEVGGIAMVRIKQYHIVNVLKREIKEIY